MMENENLMELNVPEFWYEHDENGKRVSLSFIGCWAVLIVGVAVAHGLVRFMRSILLDNIDIDDVLK